MSDATSWGSWIGRYVDDLVERGHIRSGRVERAFRRVPRHRCIAAYHARGGRRVEVPQGEDAVVPDEVLSYIYSDSAPVTKLEGDRPVSSSTGPAVMAEMLEALDLRGGERVLEIGAGTGYNAALLAEITDATVVTVDHAVDVAQGARDTMRRLGEERVTVVAADGYHGHAETGPYDRVMVTVGAPGIAEPWMDQLALDGFVVAPVLLAGAHPVLGVERGPPWTAAGRGIWWTDFMVGGGALAHRHERMFTSPADWGPFALDEPRVVRRFEPRLGDRAYDGLAAFVTFTDRRAGPRVIEGHDPELGTCVVRDPTGATAVFQRTGIVVDGPDSFVADVLDLADRWFGRGSPPFTEWRFELTLEDQPTGRFWRPHRWTVPEPPSLSPAILNQLVALMLVAYTQGLQALLARSADATSDGAAEDSGGIRGLFDLIAQDVEELHVPALDAAADLAAEAATEGDAPEWAAQITGRIVALVVLRPVDQPLQLAGLLLRVLGRALDDYLEGEQPRPAQEELAQLFDTEGSRTKRRQLLTASLEEELHLLFAHLPADQHEVWRLILSLRPKPPGLSEPGQRPGPGPRLRP
jgi:protein-L-isoaspartate(D-aspartate) O-methyltransferase